MNLLKKAEQIAGLLKQAADLEAIAKKTKKDEEPTDLDLDAIPTPDLEGKGLDELKPEIPAAKEPTAGSAFDSLKQELLANKTPAAAVSSCTEQILGEINNNADLFDTHVQDLLRLVAVDPELKNVDSASLKEALDSIKPSKHKTPAAEEPAAEPAGDPLADEPAPVTDDALKDGSDGLPGSDVPERTEPEANNAALDLGSTIESKNSLFDYLTKTAFDMNTLAGNEAPSTEQQTLAVTGLSEDDTKAFLNWASDYLTMGSAVDAESVASNYLNENKLPNDPETVAKYVEVFDQHKTGSFSNLMMRQAALDAFLKEVKEYKEDTSAEDAIIAAAKTASSAEEFLSKVATQESLFKKANTIDEPTSSPQHPGKKMFNGDTVSFTNGKQQYWPGQKVTQTRDGGNAEVVSVFNFKGTPDVDVYNNKPARKSVTSINTPNGGTIAFFQPIKEEPVEISKPVDTTGVVTGEVQKNPGVKEQLAGAGHETQNYLDQVFKLSDKPKVAGPLPTAKAGFTFNGLTKTAEAGNLFADNTPSSTSGTSALGTDAGCGPNQDKLQADRPKTLTQEQVVEAQKAFKDKEGQLVASAADKDVPEEKPADAPKAEEPKADKPEDPAKDQLNDPNTVDPMEYEKVKMAVEALPQDKLAQVKEVADNVNLLKQKLEEVIVMTNPGEQLPTLNDEGYKRLAKEVFQVEMDPKKINAPAPAKTSNEGKKAEPAADGLGATDKKPAGDKDIFSELGL